MASETDGSGEEEHQRHSSTTMEASPMSDPHLNKPPGDPHPEIPTDMEIAADSVPKKLPVSAKDGAERATSGSSSRSALGGQTFKACA